MAWLLRTLLVSVFLTPSPSSQAGELVDDIVDGPCAGCRITLTERREYFAPCTEREMGQAVAATVDAVGPLCAVSRERDGVLLLDEGGQFIRRTGRTGRGLGGPDRILLVPLGDGNSLLIIDAARCSSVVGPESFDVTRAVPLRYDFECCSLAGDRPMWYQGVKVGSVPALERAAWVTAWQIGLGVDL